jgi:hypothetical protein
MLLEVHKLFKADMDVQMLIVGKEGTAANSGKPSSVADATRRDSQPLAELSAYYEILVAAIVEKGLRPASMSSAEVGMEVLWTSSHGRQLRVLEEMKAAHAEPTVKLYCLLVDAYRQAGQLKRIPAIAEILAPESAYEQLHRVPLSTLRIFADALREHGTQRRLDEIRKAIAAAEATERSDQQVRKVREHAAEQLDVARSLEDMVDINFNYPQ